MSDLTKNTKDCLIPGHFVVNTFLRERQVPLRHINCHHHPYFTKDFTEIVPHETLAPVTLRNGHEFLNQD